MFLYLICICSCICHRGKTDDWPMMSRPTDVFNDYFVCYQDLSEYVGLANIERGFHGEPALNKYDGIFINTAVGGVGLYARSLSSLYIPNKSVWK